MKLERRSVLSAVLVLAAYFAAARFSLSLTILPEGIAVLWLPSGLLLGALLLAPARDWPWILAGGWTGHLLAELSARSLPITAIGYASTAAIEALAGAWLVRRWTGRGRPLSSAQGLVTLLAVVAIASAPLSALLGATVDRIAGTASAFADVAQVWWVSVTLGVTVLTPLVLEGPALAADWRAPRLARAAESLIWLASMIAAALIVFGEHPGRAAHLVPLLCLPFPLLTWAGLRLGSGPLTIGTLVFSVIAVWRTVRGDGVMNSIEGTVEHHVMWLQAYLAIAAVPALLLARLTTERSRAMRTLRDSETTFRELAETSPLAMVVVDRSGAPRYVNPRFVELFGWALADLPDAESWLRRTQPDPARRERLRQQWRAAISGEPGAGAEPIEARISCRDETTREVEMRASAMGSRTLFVFWDLTERKCSEAALRESEMRYRIMAEQTGQLVYDYDVSSGRIAWLGAIEQVTGYRPDQFRAIDITGWENLIHPEDRAEALHRLDVAMRLCGAYHVEYRFRRRGGDYVVIEDHGVFLPDENGRATRMLGTMGDVTRRRLAEQEVRDSAARVEQIFENSAEAIFVMRVDPDGTFTNESMNALGEIAIGRKRSEVYGRTPAEVFGPELAAKLIANFHRALAAGEPLQYEEALDFGAGPRTWQTTLVPIRDSNGRVGRLAGFARDVTERRDAERARAALETQLRQAQKMEALGTLAGGIAHDFNNILTAVVGNLELLRLRVPDDPAAQENLDAMHEASRRAAELVRQILTFSRQREQERRIVSLSPIVREVGRLLRSALPATIDLRTTVDSDLPPVLADPSQMHQVLMNLATNAAHAMRGRGGRLEIRLEAVDVTTEMVRARPELRAGRAVRLTMSDTGEGMEPAMLERIFEPFFTTKPPGEGTGLGLSVVHGIVRAHDGAIVVESQRGRGTAFHVYLPAVEEPQQDHAGRVSQAPRGHGERVLFVDDEPAVARVAESVLRHLGYEVSSRTSPVEALAELCTTSDRYDVLITDLTMPGMTGLELAERAHQQLPDLPILLTTGYSSELTLESVRSLGIREFLPKPFTGESVGRLLRDTLASTASRAESDASDAVPPVAL